MDQLIEFVEIINFYKVYIEQGIQNLSLNLINTLKKKLS